MQKLQICQIEALFSLEEIISGMLSQPCWQSNLEWCLYFDHMPQSYCDTWLLWVSILNYKPCHIPLKYKAWCQNEWPHKACIHLQNCKSREIISPPLEDHIKIVGVIGSFSYSSTSIGWISTTKLVLLWQIYDEASLKIKTSHDLVTMIGSAYSLIPWLDTSVLLLVFVIECEVVNIVWRIVQPLSNMCLYVVCSEFSPNYTPIKYRSMSDQVFLFFFNKT